MSKIDWKRKLASRKFWASIAGAVASFGAAFGVHDSVITQIVGIIGGVGSICFYIFTEGKADIAHIESNQTVTIETPEEDNPEEDDEDIAVEVIPEDDEE
jgi:hypothetical protein